MNPSPYWIERMAEERMHLQRMPGINKRREPANLDRLARIDTELSRLARNGKRRTVRPRLQSRGV